MCFFIDLLCFFKRLYQRLEGWNEKRFYLLPHSRELRNPFAPQSLSFYFTWMFVAYLVELWYACLFKFFFFLKFCMQRLHSLVKEKMPLGEVSVLDRSHLEVCSLISMLGVGLLLLYTNSLCMHDNSLTFVTPGL